MRPWRNYGMANQGTGLSYNPDAPPGPLSMLVITARWFKTPGHLHHK
jgi:hypothetical protein